MAKQMITIDLGPWELCEDPNCNHASHGSLRKVVNILLAVRERVRQKDPERYARLVAEEQARMQVKEAQANAAAGRAG